MANLNFSSVPKREPLPEGVYALTVMEAEETESSAGNPMIKIKFSEPDTKTVIFENFSLLPQALFKIQGFMEALGYDVSSDMDFDPKDLIGYVVTAKVVQEEYEGTPRNKIKSYVK